jgi:hypothetical protein
MNKDFLKIGEFLSTLHSKKTCGVLSFEALGDNKREMYRSDGRGADGLFNWIEQQHKLKRGVYLRQARLDPLSKTCRKTDVLELTHIWVDIDGAGTERVQDIVNKFKPTYVIHSGGGLHVYWRLPKPVSDAVQLQKAEIVMKELANAMDGDPAPTHIASLLRLPYTINFKYDPPVMSRIVHAQPETEHTLYDLEHFALAHQDPYEKVVGFLTNNVRMGMTTQDWSKVIANLAVSGNANEFGGRNNCVVKLAGYWSRNEINPRTQMRTLLEYGCNLPFVEIQSIVDRIWERENESV